MRSRDHHLLGHRAHDETREPFNELGRLISFDATDYPVIAKNVNANLSTIHRIQADMYRGVVRAAYAYVAGQDKKPLAGISGALGSRSLQNGEAMYAEIRDENDPDKKDIYELAYYDPSCGWVKALHYNKKAQTGAEVNINKNETARKGNRSDGAAVFLAMFPAMVEAHDDLPIAIARFADAIRNKNQVAEPFQEPLAAICYIVGKLIKDGTFPLAIDDKTDKLPRINTVAVNQGIFGPAEGKVLLGEFRALSVGDKKKMSPTARNFPDEWDFPFQKKWEALTDAEKEMVPQKSPRHVVTEDMMYVVRQMHKYWDHKTMKRYLVILEGCSSSGKSYLAESAAMYAKRPFVRMALSANMTEFDLLGGLVPKTHAEASVEDAKDAALCTFHGHTLKTLPPLAELKKKVLGNLEEVLFDPSAYVGREASAKEAATLYMERSDELAEGYSRFKYQETSKSPSSGVEYVYYKSPLVEAIHNGWWVEVQEWTTLKDSAIMTRFNEIFDVTSPGILATPYGTIRRHPDFAAFLTTNPGYNGTKAPHQSIPARSFLKVEMNNPKKKEFIKRVKAFVGEELSDDLAEGVYATISAINAKLEAESIQNADLTLRAAYTLADDAMNGVEYDRAIQNLLLNLPIDEEDREELRDCIDPIIADYCS